MRIPKQYGICLYEVDRYYNDYVKKYLKFKGLHTFKTESNLHYSPEFLIYMELMNITDNDHIYLTKLPPRNHSYKLMDSEPVSYAESFIITNNVVDVHIGRIPNVEYAKGYNSFYYKINLKTHWVCHLLEKGYTLDKIFGIKK